MVELFFQYSYDTASEYPMWKELKGAQAKATVRNGVAEFFLLFGPAPPSGLPGSHFSNILLPRPDPALAAAATASALLPLLSYQVMAAGSPGREMESAEWLLDGRLWLRPTWGEVVFYEAVDMYNTMATGAMRDFLPSSVVFAKLRELWSHLFAFISKRQQHRMKGKHDAADSARADDPTIERPLLFTEELFFRIIRVAHPDAGIPANIPSLIQRRVFSGASPTEGGSIMRVFHTLVDLFGRSRLVRRLYQSGKIILASSSDTIDFDQKSFAPAASPVVFFFRVPRSIVHEPALVLELFQVGPDGQHTPLRPTPYITSSQLEKAGGEPLVAFTKLDSSVHIEHLRRLSWDDMLESRWDAGAQGHGTTIHLSAPRKYAAYPQSGDGGISFDCRPAVNHLEPGWWESQAILQPSAM